MAILAGDLLVINGMYSLSEWLVECECAYTAEGAPYRR